MLPEPSSAATLSPPPEPRRGNPFGIASVGLAATALLVSVILIVTSFATPTLNLDFDIGYERIAQIFVALNAVVLLLAVLGLGLGITGMVRRGSPRTAAALGTGACGFAVVEALVSVLTSITSAAL